MADEEEKTRTDWFERERRLTEALAENDFVGILQEVRVKALMSELPMGQDDDYRTSIMSIVSHLKEICPPGLYADLLGDDDESRRLCHLHSGWPFCDHTMRKPTAEEHKDLTTHVGQGPFVCTHCGLDFSSSTEGDEGYWHCFDCHSNQEPEYDNHLCHPCGIVEGVGALLQKMLPRCDDCGQNATLEDYSDIPVGSVLTCSTEFIESGEVCGSTNFSEIKLR